MSKMYDDYLSHLILSRLEAAELRYRKEQEINEWREKLHNLKHKKKKRKNRKH